MLKNPETIVNLSQIEHLRDKCLLEAEMDYLEKEFRINRDFLYHSMLAKQILCENDKEADKLLQEYQQESEKLLTEYEKKLDQLIKRYQKKANALIERTELEAQNIV